MTSFGSYIDILQPAVLEAGRAIVEIASSGNKQAEEKEDGSPVTLADHTSNLIVTEALQTHTPWMVVSEEVPMESQLEERFWLVDPLDGTKSFISGGNDYVICVGLIENGSPVCGVIHQPVTGDTFWAAKGEGVFCNGEKLHFQKAKKSALVSRSHLDETTKSFLTTNDITQTSGIGSALKFCRLAQGAVAVYPRFAPTREWDTAAGQVLVEEMGGSVIDLETGKSLAYGKVGFLNKGFLASQKGWSWVMPN